MRLGLSGLCAVFCLALLSSVVTATPALAVSPAIGQQDRHPTVALAAPRADSLTVYIREQYDARIGAFRCYFTGLPLDVSYGSRRSAEWAHRVPGDESSVVLCCKLVNRMQTDLTETEFREFIITLARHFQGAPFDESAFPGA